MYWLGGFRSLCRTGSKRIRLSHLTDLLVSLLYKAFKKAQPKELALMIATAVFTETLDNFQHSTWPISESRSCTLNSSRETIEQEYFVCWSYTEGPKNVYTLWMLITRIYIEIELYRVTRI
jgi:hypothetical protein